MPSLARFLVRTSLAVLLGLPLAAGAWADDLLYASNYRQLFAIDLQAHTFTFVSDGPLKLIVSPAFDEAHHTVFDPFGVWTTSPQYYYADPFTGGEWQGPAPATVSGPIPDANSHTWFSGGGGVVYAPTTERVYGMFWVYNSETKEGKLGSNMIDQFAGPQLLNWGSYATGALLPWGDLPDRTKFIQATTFDPLSGMILVAVSQVGGMLVGQDYLFLENSGVAILDPVTGYWQSPIAFEPYEYLDVGADNSPHASIEAIAAEPTTGDIYYVRNEGQGGSSSTTLRRWDRAQGKSFQIGELDGRDYWSLRFADARYASP